MLEFSTQTQLGLKYKFRSCIFAKIFIGFFVKICPSLSLLSCSGHPLFSVLSRQTWSSWPFWPTCPGWPVPVVLSMLSYPSCHTLAVLSFAVLSRFSCPSCPVLSDKKVGNPCNFCGWFLRNCGEIFAKFTREFSRKRIFWEKEILRKL